MAHSGGPPKPPKNVDISTIYVDKMSSFSLYDPGRGRPFPLNPSPWRSHHA